MNVRKLAELTEVSVATISRVLKGDLAVKSKTRERIIRELAKHPFYPDLKQKKKPLKNIFVFLSTQDISNRLYQSDINFYSRTFSGIKSYLDYRSSQECLDYYLLLISFQSGIILKKLGDLENLPYSRYIGGIFIVHTKIQDDKDLVCYKGDLRLYALGRSRDEIPNDRINCIYFDNNLVSKLAYEHLIHRGHNQIVVISGSRDYKYLLMRENHFRLHEQKHQFYFRNTEKNTPEAAYTLMRNIYEKEKLPHSAIYITAEFLLEGVLRYLDENQIIIPSNLSVLSTNDYLLAYQHSPPISVVRTPSFEIGRLSAVLALENNQFDYKSVVDYCLGVVLNDRGSVAELK
jgi:LacI family transcriptional regulator